MSIEPQSIFYDWHVHEVFNETPQEVYVPYGSGRLFENYLTWQMRNLRNKDRRLSINLENLSELNIFAVEPEKQESIANKLTKPFNPYAIYAEEDINALKLLKFTGKKTNIVQVPEERIKQAHDVMKKYCETEPSGSAGLAHYLERYEQGKINPKHKIIIVNTGQEKRNLN